jgi:hypothetical protein
VHADKEEYVKFKNELQVFLVYFQTRLISEQKECVMRNKSRNGRTVRMN